MQRGQRGFAMVFTLFVTLLLLVIGLSILAVSSSSSLTTLNVERKQDSFDAAEAGLNQAIDQLDQSTGYSATGSSGSFS